MGIPDGPLDSVQGDAGANTALVFFDVIDGSNVYEAGQAAGISDAQSVTAKTSDQTNNAPLKLRLGLDPNRDDDWRSNIGSLKERYANLDPPQQSLEPCGNSEERSLHEALREMFHSGATAGFNSELDQQASALGSANTGGGHEAGQGTPLVSGGSNPKVIN